MSSHGHSHSHGKHVHSHQPHEILESPDYEELKKHTKLFEKKLFSIPEKGVYCFVGWNMANITIVESKNNSLIVVDTGEDNPQMREVWNAFKASKEIREEVKGWPVKAVILTHHHADHVNGTAHLRELFPEIGELGKGNIWGADNLHAEFLQENGLISPIMSCRAMAMYNGLLNEAFPEEVAGLSSGIGPLITQAESTGYIPPNKLINTQLPYQIQRYTIEGLKFEFVYVPSEANSEIGCYLPERKVLFSAEVIQDHAFPNIYTMRGAKFREPSNWSRSIDCFMTNFPLAENMILQHGPPILHNEKNPHEDPMDDPTTFLITEVLTRYRDAIQLVRDQTLRWTMKGYAKDEIMQLVKLPFVQQDFKPWLQPFYGTVMHSVPAVYTGYIGWFDGDPVALQPLPRSVMSKYLVDHMGGSDKVKSLAHDAIGRGDTLAKSGDFEGAKMEWQLAAELATYLIRSHAYTKVPEPVPCTKGHPYADGIPSRLLHPVFTETDDKEPRQIKADCFRRFAKAQINANWHGTYLTAAHELEGDQLTPIILQKCQESFLLKAENMEIMAMLDTLAIRLIGEKAFKIESDKSVIFLAEEETKKNYRLEVRNCVLNYCEYTGDLTGCVVIRGSTKNLNILLDGSNGFTFENVIFTPKGGEAIASRFFSFFEAGRFNPPNIYVH